MRKLIIKYENWLAKTTESWGKFGYWMRKIFGTHVWSGLFFGLMSLMMTLPYQLCFDAGYWIASDIFMGLAIFFFAWPGSMILYYIFYGLIYNYIIRQVILKKEPHQ